MLVGLGWTLAFGFGFTPVPCVFWNPGWEKKKYMEHVFLRAEGESSRALLEICHMSAQK